LEFPVVARGDTGQPWTRTYVAVHRRGTDATAERYDAVACFDHASGQLTETDLGHGRYPSEPIIAADAKAGDQRQWLLTLVYDGNADASEVWVFDAARLNEEPTCVLALPGVVPLGFHGCWNPAR
jgi:carotenoid cleavage dioxygenase-like enzyme